MPLSQIPAETVWLSSRLSKIAPARLGITKKTWANIVSNGLAALVQAGVTKTPLRRLRLDDEWQMLWSKLEDRRLRISLRRFMGFCSRQGIRPEAVSDRNVTEFAEALTIASLHKNPHSPIYYLTIAWNKAAGRIAGWPNVRLTVPRKKFVLAIPRAELPVSFRQDLERYLTVMSCADPLTPNAPAKALATATLARCYRKQVAAIHKAIQNGERIDPEASLIIRSLIDHIVVEACAPGMPVQLAVHGDLAALLQSDNQ